MFHISHITCQASHVTCHVSHVKKKKNKKSLDTVVVLVDGGFLSTGPTQSSFHCITTWNRFCSHKKVYIYSYIYIIRVCLVSVLLSILIERFSVSHMQVFFVFNWGTTAPRRLATLITTVNNFTIDLLLLLLSNTPTDKHTFAFLELLRTANKIIWFWNLCGIYL